MTLRAKLVAVASLIAALLASSGRSASTVPLYTFQTLDVPGAITTNANGINNAGQIVGTYFANDMYHGFLLDGGNYTSLDVPGAIRAYAQGINDAAQIVGSYEDAQFRNHGFLATAVPEPSSLTLFGVGVLGFVGYGWLRRGKRGSFLFHEAGSRRPENRCTLPAP